MIPSLHGVRPQEEVVLRVRKVMLVDEALPVRRALQEMLHRAGIASSNVQTFTTAQSALDAFAAFHPTVVFTELVGETPAEGLDMVHEMLTIDPRVKIVLVTAEAHASPLVRAAVRAGVFAVVQKPLRHEKIRQVISEMENEEGGIERFR